VIPAFNSRDLTLWHSSSLRKLNLSNVLSLSCFANLESDIKQIASFFVIALVFLIPLKFVEEVFLVHTRYRRYANKMLISFSIVR